MGGGGLHFACLSVRPLTNLARGERSGANSGGLVQKKVLCTVAQSISYRMYYSETMALSCFRLFHQYGY